MMLVCRFLLDSQVPLLLGSTSDFRSGGSEVSLLHTLAEQAAACAAAWVRCRHRV